VKRAPPGLDALLAEASRLAARAAARVLADPRGQEALARAVGLAQRSLQRIEALQAELLRAAGVPGRQDYQALARQLARVKRKARELSEKLAARQAGGPGRGLEDPAGGGSTPPDERDPGAR
jgi:3-methyladenine DNA glycosylase/8-oxoguanine DNA glycosylase